MAARHEEGCYENICPHVFLFAKYSQDYRTMTSQGCRGNIIIQEITPEVGFKTWGGATVERLKYALKKDQ